ncbi:hypothetical protein FHG87_010898 [Trinorchestia longiramus]|nr:hypothetical protein FHG87_010898 [Trinorchestia longiramus]
MTTAEKVTAEMDVVHTNPMSTKTIESQIGIFMGYMISLQGHITAQNFVNILVIQVYPMVQTLFPIVMGSCKMAKPMFTQLISSRTGFLNTRMISHTSHQSPDLNNMEP